MISRGVFRVEFLSSFMQKTDSQLTPKRVGSVDLHEVEVLQLLLHVVRPAIGAVPVTGPSDMSDQGRAGLVPE